MFFVSPENEFIQVENEISVKADLFEDFNTSFFHSFGTSWKPVENKYAAVHCSTTKQPAMIIWRDKRIWNDLYGGRKEQRWRVWHSSQIRNRKEEEMDREYKAWQTKRKI